MPYITRGDGEHFVIPSYRDIITSKNKMAIRTEILALSKSYGEFITLQRKGPTKYEVAFSADRGYLLGESIWNYFKRPLDMVYCEAVPGSKEAILVIVKAGSVYLDGSFPLDSISEELVVFLTEQNNFEIYIYGDVPITQTPQDGKFSFETTSVKSFSILDQPVFPTVALYKFYRFDFVESVLSAHGIGVFPTKKLLTILLTIAVSWMGWSFMKEPVEKLEIVAPSTPEIDPYLGYYNSLSSPAPDAQIDTLLDGLSLLYSMPGWYIKDLSYSNGSLTANIHSPGVKLETLSIWAKAHQANVMIRSEGVTVTLSKQLENRPRPEYIYPIKQILMQLIDRIATVYPGNHLQPGESSSRGPYTEMKLGINIDKISPATLSTIGKQLKGYPIIMESALLTMNDDSLSGTLNLLILGS